MDYHFRKRGRKPSRYRVIFWEALSQSTSRPIGEILDSIDSLTKEAFASIDRPDEVHSLSEAVAKMPAYMKGLGYYLADAENEVSLTKDELEFHTLTKEKAIIQAGKSVAEATRIAGTDEELVLLRDKYRKARHNYRVLKLQYDASDRQFEGWRSRLSTIKHDLREGV